MIILVEVAHTDDQWIHVVGSAGRETAVAFADKDLQFKVVLHCQIGNAVAIEVGGCEKVATNDTAPVGRSRGEVATAGIEKRLQKCVAVLIAGDGDDVEFSVMIDIGYQYPDPEKISLQTDRGLHVEGCI